MIKPLNKRLYEIDRELLEVRKSLEDTRKILLAQTRLVMQMADALREDLSLTMDTHQRIVEVESDLEEKIETQLTSEEE